MGCNYEFTGKRENGEKCETQFLQGIYGGNATGAKNKKTKKTPSVSSVVFDK